MALGQPGPFEAGDGAVGRPWPTDPGDFEALDEASLRSALRRVPAVAPDLLGACGEPEIYQGMFALDARIADFE